MGLEIEGLASMYKWSLKNVLDMMDFNALNVKGGVKVHLNTHK